VFRRDIFAREPEAPAHGRCGRELDFESEAASAMFNEESKLGACARAEK